MKSQLMGQPLLQRTPALPGRAGRSRRAHRLPAQSVALAEPEAPLAAEGADLLPRPQRPLRIWRAPPSQRTIDSKEKQQMERVEAAHAKFEATRARATSGPGGGAPLAAPVRPNRYQERGGGDRGGRGPAGRPGVGTATAPAADQAARGPAGAGRGGGWGNNNGRGRGGEWAQLGAGAMGWRVLCSRPDVSCPNGYAERPRTEAWN